jgi:hypothetical protein
MSSELCCPLSYPLNLREVIVEELSRRRRAIRLL